MNTLTKHVPFFHLLLTTHKQQKQALLKSASKAQITALCEILLNIITKALPLTAPEENYVIRQQKNIRAILKKSTATRKKQNLLSSNLKLVDIILAAILNQVRDGNEDSAEVHSDTDREIQKDEQLT